MIRNVSARRDHWSSRWAFILAATGSAVGLGNIWKFPYMAGESGGGAFVLIHLVLSASGGFAGFDAQAAQARFGGLLANPQRMLLWHSALSAFSTARHE